MKPFEIVLKEIPCLYEYQKKQLAMFLISETLNAQSNLETFKIIEKMENMELKIQKL
jgi:hypothetical protein